jgi:hypothetical protein
MAVYTQILTYTFRDALALGNPSKTIYGAYLDGELNAIHNASLDAASLAGSNSFVGSNTFKAITSTVASGIAIQVNGGSVVVGSPTGGDKGAGTVNATGIYVNGSAIGAGSGTVTSVGVSSNGTYSGAVTVGASPVTTSGTITLTPNVFTSIAPGVVPLSGGGTTNFLRADGSWSVPAGTTFANPTATIGLTAVNGSASTSLRSDGAPALSQSIVPTWSGAHTFSAGATISTGSAVTALVVTGAAGAGNYAAQIVGANSAGARGLGVIGGTANADYCATFSNAASSANLLLIHGDGQLQGYGPTAATNLDMTPDKGSFTITGTGFTANPTATASWVRLGQQVTIYIPSLQGTSNATTFTLTGIPSAIQPPTLTSTISPVSGQDNGAASALMSITITAASGTWTVSNGVGNWTASGTKRLAFATGLTFTYPLM